MLLSIPQIQKLENTGFCYSLAVRLNGNRRAERTAGAQQHCAAGRGQSVDEMGDKGRKQCQGQGEIEVEKVWIMWIMCITCETGKICNRESCDI